MPAAARTSARSSHKKERNSQVAITADPELNLTPDPLQGETTKKQPCPPPGLMRKRGGGQRDDASAAKVTKLTNLSFSSTKPAPAALAMATLEQRMLQRAATAMATATAAKWLRQEIDLLTTVRRNDDESVAFQEAAAIMELQQDQEALCAERIAHDPIFGGECKGCGLAERPFRQCTGCGAAVEPNSRRLHYCWGEWRLGADCTKCGGTEPPTVAPDGFDYVAIEDGNGRVDPRKTCGCDATTAVCILCTDGRERWRATLGA